MMTRGLAMSATPSLIVSPALPPLLYILSSQPGGQRLSKRRGELILLGVWRHDSAKLGQNNDMGNKN